MADKKPTQAPEYDADGRLAAIIDSSFDAIVAKDLNSIDFSLGLKYVS